ncbi:hypothetical protein [uncultured Clostridium sp.]|uniref:hypothetical protein n=1 Tax=uncultured Clostridium sp. TaxID=59620 RepID=UPI00260A173A|nr:hypothetical protein [uncultured Clostridium sp.]
MLIDIYRKRNFLIARPRSTIKECKVKLKITNLEEDFKKINQMTINKFNEMANKYYTKGFTNEEIFQEGNIIELRNGVQYRIQKCAIKSCLDFNTNKNIMEAIAINETPIKKLSDASWDDFGFFGIETSMDIVKVFDSDMHLKAERTQYNVLSSQELIKI